MMIMVHSASFEAASKKIHTCVKVSAGQHTVITESSSKGVFQQPLGLHVDQGTDFIVVDLVQDSDVVIGRLKLDPAKDILEAGGATEKTFNMRSKKKGVLNATVTLTMVCGDDGDMETGLLSGKDGVNWLTMQHMKKTVAQVKEDTGNCDEMDVLKEACCGPVLVNEMFGSKSPAYIGIIGPPASRRWTLGLWDDEEDYRERGAPKTEIELLRVSATQADPSQPEFFHVAYVDESRLKQTLTCSHVDRSREVWVEMLQLLISKVREKKEGMKHTRKMQTHIAEKKPKKKGWF